MPAPKNIENIKKWKEKLSKAHKGKLLGDKNPAKRLEFSEMRLGQNNPAWKGGVTSVNKLLRISSKWKIWRELVFLRDNFTCQNKNCKFCNNKIGGKLHPHHIKPVALFPELVFRVDNGITYCAEFHIKGGIHKGLLKNVNN